MNNPQSRKRFAIIFSFFMALGLFFAAKLPQISTSSIYKETAEVAETRVQEAMAEVERQNTVPGEVYDRNGIKLVVSDEESGELTYLDDTIYSNLLGFISDGDSSLLMGNMKDVLYNTEGGVNKGNNLHLTLDSELQAYAYELLSMGEGERSSVAILDAKTGAILALASNPSYSVSSVIENKGGFPDNTPSYVSTPLQSPSRPGSIFKVVTSVGIIENNLDGVFIEDNGSYRFPDNSVIKDAPGEPTGTWSLKEGLIHSSNVYFGRMTAENLGWKVMDNLAERFLVTNQGLNFEFGHMSSTYESDLEPYYRESNTIQLAQVGFGYAGLQLTALQAAMITQSVANKGEMSMPYLVDEVTTNIGWSTGENTYEYEEGPFSSETINGCHKGETTRVMAESTAATISDYMKATYENKYTRINRLTQGGVVVNGQTYSIALKTGTADMVDDGSYNNIWMVSFAPVEDPQYVIAINRYWVPGGTYGISLLDDVVSIYEKLFDNQ